MWNFWLASQSYESAPKKIRNQGQEDTRTPIDPSFRSAFISKKAEDVAEWLKDKPNDVDLDEHHFAILDRGAEEDETVVVCRIGDAHFKGDKLDWIRFPAKTSGGMDYGNWEDFRGEGPPSKIKY